MLETVLKSGRLLSEHVDIIVVTLDHLAASPNQPLKTKTVLSRLKSIALTGAVSTTISLALFKLAAKRAALLVPASLAIAVSCRIAWARWRQRCYAKRMQMFIDQLNAFDVNIRRHVKRVRDVKPLGEAFEHK